MSGPPKRIRALHELPPAPPPPPQVRMIREGVTNDAGLQFPPNGNYRYPGIGLVLLASAVVGLVVGMLLVAVGGRV